ncbi:MAG TPA: hypothetical protein VN577_18905 [Terriglobales bacterium]|nr:hypothetical protein [Terriglobales bacterium]
MNARKPDSVKFETISQSDLPSGRKGRHHALLAKVLSELDQLKQGRAIKIPLSDFPGSVADLRSAIHRATRKTNIEIATSSDGDYFYLWKPIAAE